MKINVVRLFYKRELIWVVDFINNYGFYFIR